MRTIPCTPLDTATARDVVLTTGLVINSRLDAKKLEGTLCTLVECKFPRAGARLAFRNGVYELQIPNTFDAKTPPAIFTVEDYPETYRSPARSEIPTTLTDSQPSIIPAPELEVYLRSKTCPSTLEGFLKPNVPLLHIHIAVFDDFTFVGVTSPHIAFDALGTATLLFAWTCLLSGDELGTITEPRRGWFDLGLFSKLSFMVRFILRIVMDPKEVRYFVRVPKAFLRESKRKIMDELELQGSSEYVGSSDVLLAWWLKTVYSHRQPSDNTPIHLHVVTDLRGKPIFARKSTLTNPYIHNAVSFVPVPPTPVNAFRTESLGALALRVRRAIIAVNADPAVIRTDSSWLAARFGGLDFSGACVTGGNKAVARVMFIHPVVTSSQSRPMRGSGGVLIEDEHVVWMDQHRGRKDWYRIRRSGAVAFA
ncbi:hypothetical protein B0H19DRAFT_1071813 [Mycena capillaripes]|nr:hypothetical protein B0H19DRAFT_1071813 [Mycena capillaripes]